MTKFFSSHFPIFLTLIFALYSQLIVKWQMNLVSGMPEDMLPKLMFLVKLLFNPWMISAALATFVSGLAWMNAMTRFELGYAYLYISLLFLLTIVASVLLFQEPLNLPKVLGGGFILVGIILLGYGQQV